MQIAPMNPWIHMYYATTGINARGVLINGGQQITRQEVLELYTEQQRLVPARGGRSRLDRGRQARRPRRAQQRLLHRARRGSEEDPLGADGRRRQHQLRRRRAGYAPLVVEAAVILRQYRERLEAQALAPQLAAGENPCLELMTMLLAAPRELWAELDLEERRRELASLFSWGVPNARALDVLAAHAPLVECGAGMGYWSALLKARGVDVLAYDIAPPGRRSAKRISPLPALALDCRSTREDSVRAARRHGDRTLVLCWPPFDDDLGELFGAARLPRRHADLHRRSRRRHRLGALPSRARAQLDARRRSAAAELAASCATA